MDREGFSPHQAGGHPGFVHQGTAVAFMKRPAMEQASGDLPPQALYKARKSVLLARSGQQDNAFGQDGPAMHGHRLTAAFSRQPFVDQVKRSGWGGLVYASQRPRQPRLHELRRVGGVKAGQSGHEEILPPASPASYHFLLIVAGPN